MASVGNTEPTPMNLEEAALDPEPSGTRLGEVGAEPFLISKHV